MTRIVALLLSLTLAGLALAYPLKIRHDAGETVIQNKPERIIAMGPYMLDILLSLGVQPVGYASVGVGVDNWGLGAKVTEVPGLPALRSSPVNVGLRQSPSLETMLSLKPDLILAEVPTPDRFRQFSAIGPTLLFTGNLPDDWRRTILPIARALGRESQALRVLAEDKTRLNAARTKLEPIVRGKRFLMLVSRPSGPLTASFQLRTGGDWASNIPVRLGLNLVRPAGIKLGDLGLADLAGEVLPSIQTDYIIVLTQRQRGIESARREWFERDSHPGQPAREQGGASAVL
jgi:iron complex transport system substrate-binding protein